MEDNTPRAWSSPGGLQLPLDREMLEAAERMYRDNRGAWGPTSWLQGCLWRTASS
jgi:hypothetical protein